jgi:hypothetical protein
MRQIRIVNTALILSLIVILSSLLGACKSRTIPSETGTVAQPSMNGGWTSLFDGETLNGWEITNFGPQGPVYVSGGQIYLEMGDAITGIHRAGDFPVVNYEIRLEAMKVHGNDFFCGMTFPVKEFFCSLIIGGWSGSIVGLSNIDGLDASENETTTFMGFDADTWYDIRLKVTPDKIEAWVGNEKIVDFLTAGRILTIRPEVESSRPFGIASWRTTAALKNIRFRLLP